MRLNRGCGCLLASLGILDALIVVIAILSVVRHTLNAPQGALVMFVAGGNAVAVFALGWAAVRGAPVGRAAADQVAGDSADEVSGVEVEEGIDDE